MKNRIFFILKKLKEYSPDPHTELVFSNVWELLVAVILSAQCTDKKVNEVTKKLFNKYPHFSDYLKADIHVFENDINSIGLFRNKARYILYSAQKIDECYLGKVPRNMSDLLTLPGVARKTANVVLFNGFGIQEGIAVDTHVGRVSQRLELTGSNNPLVIEKDLCRLIPQKDWGAYNSRMVQFGRYVCQSRRPLCSTCSLNSLCSFSKTI